MRTVLSIIIIIVCASILIVCHKNKKAKKSIEAVTPDPDEKNDTVDDVADDSNLILKLNYLPGGEVSKEEFDKKNNTWQITSERHVTDKNGVEITLSRKDMDKVVELYSKLCDGNITETDNTMYNGPFYSLIVYTENNEMLAYDWNQNHQVEEVYQIAEIIWEYY